MIISEKQIMQLITFAHMFRADMLNTKFRGLLSETGEQTVSDVSRILGNISNQQSDELKEIEDA